MSQNLVIAIDGPAGAGKSTVAKIVAARLGLRYVDTGAMYRAITLKALRQGISLDDHDSLCDLAVSSDIELSPMTDKLTQTVTLDGIEVTEDIRTTEVSAAVSKVALVPKVREYLVEAQRRLAENGGAVMDGRDIGTVVLPTANLKFYLDATPEVRAARRYKELQTKGIETDYETVLADQLLRDETDSHREASPLRRADDAIIIDSSELAIEEVADLIISLSGSAVANRG